MKTRLLVKLRRLSTAFVTILLVVAPLGLAFSEAPALPTSPALPTAPALPTSPALPTAPALPGSTTTTTIPALDQSTGATTTTIPATENSDSSEPINSCPVEEAVNNNVEGDSLNPEDPLDSSEPILGDEGAGAEPTIGNENTGAESTNESTVFNANSVIIDNENDAEVNNGLVVSSNTGDNDANYNTGSGSVKTGDSNIILSILNLINTTFVALPGGEIKFLFENIAGNLFGNYLIDPNSGEAYTLTGSRVSADNSNTGAESQNSTIINTNNSTFVNNDNDGKVGNTFNIDSNTGDNDSSYNTGNGSVTTGDSNVSLNLLNFLNSTFTASSLGLVGVLNIFGDWVGDLLIPKDLASNTAGSGSGSGAVVLGNSNTGFDSSNLTDVKTSNALDVDNDNNAEVLNNIKIANNTGNNTSGYNTGDGSVQTGDVNTELNVGNLLNQNLIGDTIFFFIVNVAGNWDGSNLLSSLGIVNNGCDQSGVCDIAALNSNTGAESENSTEVDTSNTFDIDNTNNGALSNNIVINANTGDNKADYNTGNGSVVTGDSNVLANIANIMNVNVVAKKFVFLVVNIFGDWDGNIDVEKEQVAGVTVTTKTTTQVPTEVHITTVPTISNLSKIFSAGSGVDRPVDNSIALADLDTKNKNEGAVILTSNSIEGTDSSSVLGVADTNIAGNSGNTLSLASKYKTQIFAFLIII